MQLWKETFMIKLYTCMHSALEQLSKIKQTLLEIQGKPDKYVIILENFHTSYANRLNLIAPK